MARKRQRERAQLDSPAEPAAAKNHLALKVALEVALLPDLEREDFKAVYDFFAHIPDRVAVL